LFGEDDTQRGGATWAWGNDKKPAEGTVTTLQVPSLHCASLLAAPPGIVRASSVFPILSSSLLMLGGLCVGLGRVYSKCNNILLSAGILFVAAGNPQGVGRGGWGLWRFSKTGVLHLCCSIGGVCTPRGTLKDCSGYSEYNYMYI